MTNSEQNSPPSPPSPYYPYPEDISGEQITQADRDMRERYFTASDHTDVAALREVIQILGREITLRVPPGRNKSLALTALEDVQMRANRALFAQGPSA